MFTISYRCLQRINACKNMYSNITKWKSWRHMLLKQTLTIYTFPDHFCRIYKHFSVKSKNKLFSCRLKRALIAQLFWGVNTLPPPPPPPPGRAASATNERPLTICCAKAFLSTNLISRAIIWRDFSSSWIFSAAAMASRCSAINFWASSSLNSASAASSLTNFVWSSFEVMRLFTESSYISKKTDFKRVKLVLRIKIWLW